MTEYVQDLIFAHFFEHDTAVPGRMEHNRSNCKPRKRFRASLQFLRRLQPVASTLVGGARCRCQMGPAGTHASARVRLFKPPDPCLTFACR